MRLLLSLLLLFIGSLPHGAASPLPSFEKTEDGVIVYPNKVLSGKVKLQVLTPGIIRITAAPQKKFAPAKSLMVVLKKDPLVRFTVAEGKDKVTLQTTALAAEVALNNGAAQLFDAAGKRSATEKSAGGRLLQPTIHEGKSLFQLVQSFASAPGRNLDAVISGYRTLTGKATMLPRGAFGNWQSRKRYITQDEVLQTVAKFRRRRIPLDNMVQDWSYWPEPVWVSQDFDLARFPNPRVCSREPIPCAPLCA